MGGTKKKATVPIKKESKYKIPSRFDCPLCDAKNSIAVRLMRNTGSAKLHCRSCRAGSGKEYPLLPLEKAVDVFFRFREELMQQDREFLHEHNIETDDMTTKTGLVQLIPKTAVTAAAAAGSRGESTAGRTDTMHRIEFEDDDDGSHFFSSAVAAEQEEENEGDFAF
ncbi:Transcription elongation factor 1 [Trypanosoma melophagium]|uniref:Transcription elongation factor 1 n=1 Tax=Trypanosoma melophagium TaxID=715481 RepID=UPI00351A44C3|nr:Transcription elongation factor 1 [Trypanosoma melophagium]